MADGVLLNRVNQMKINGEKLKSAITSLDESLAAYTLPDWDALPYIDLYMDQVISILEKYLEIYHEAVGGNTITASMINNYVKLGTVPPPVKKRYSRLHMAYLIIVFSLKQTLDMATIKKIISVGIEEAEVKHIYNSFVVNQKKTFSYMMETVKSIALPIIENEGDNEERLADILMQVSSSANICKVLTEKITRM